MQGELCARRLVGDHPIHTFIILDVNNETYNDLNNCFGMTLSGLKNCCIEQDSDSRYQATCTISTATQSALDLKAPPSTTHTNHKSVTVYY